MKTILICMVFFNVQAHAQIKNIRMPLPEKSYSGTTIKLSPVGKELLAECKIFAEYIIANAENLTAADVEFARALPLRGQMKDTFEADFKLGSIANIEIKKLQELKMRLQPGSLSAISTRLGLSLPPAEIFENATGPHIKVRSRDVMCDLLSNKIDFTAMVHIILSLNESDAAFLKRFYEDINADTAAVLSGHDNTFVKAALLGLVYTEIFRKHNLESNETKDNLTFLFNTLFKAGTLEVNEHRQIQTSRNLGPTPMVLKGGLK